MKVKIKLDEGATMPTRAHDTDVGYDAEFELVDSLDETERGDGGFGSTEKKGGKA